MKVVKLTILYIFQILFYHNPKSYRIHFVSYNQVQFGWITNPVSLNIGFLNLFFNIY